MKETEPEQKTVKIFYLLTFVLPILTIFGNIYAENSWNGINYSWIGILVAIFVYPVIETIWGEGKDFNPENAPTGFFDLILYIHVVGQIIGIMTLIDLTNRSPNDLILTGAILTTSINSGVSIVIAHELVHRPKKWERLLGRIILWTVNYMHFETEHIRGHHRTVATAEDPASAPAWMSLYTFFVTTVPRQYISAWRIETKRAKSLWKHRVFLWTGIEIATCLAVYVYLGKMVLIVFLLNSLGAVFLLEYVNYIRHWGLNREKGERIAVEHSWQSNYRLSRYILIELTRHPDHHLTASRPYQALKSYDDAPTLPSGYFVCFLIALNPFMWKWIMKRRLPKTSD